MITWGNRDDCQYNVELELLRNYFEVNYVILMCVVDYSNSRLDYFANAVNE